jgi:von Willebrand factor type A domain
MLTGRTMTLRPLHLSSALCFAAVAASCASGGNLQLTKISAAADQPANVAVYLDVKDKVGRPIPGLLEKNFRVYEDGKLVTTSKAKRALLEPKQFDTRYVLLLVDMSGPIVDSEDLPELSNAIAGFVDHVGATHEIAVGAFDGNDEVVPFLGYAGTAETKKVTEALRKFRPRSRNSNLNGAVYQGLHSLRDRLKEASSAQKSAILVVFTDRGELSHSVSPEALKQGLKDTDAQIYVIGVGEGIHREELTALGRSGTYLSSNPKNYKDGFAEIGKKLTNDADGRYVFSYCSPKRKGSHKVEVEAVTPKDRGRVMFKFNADGFTAGCTPKKPIDLAPKTASGKKKEGEGEEDES